MRPCLLISVALLGCLAYAGCPGSPVACSGHGTCPGNSTLAVCSCTVGWDPSLACSECAVDSWGDTCADHCAAGSNAASTSCLGVGLALCEACVTQAGKGWCGERRACMSGTSTGPTAPSVCVSWQWGVCRPSARGSSAAAPVPSLPALMSYYQLEGDLRDSMGRAPGTAAGPMAFLPLGVTGRAAAGSWSVPIDVRPASQPRLTLGAWVRHTGAAASIAAGSGAADRGLSLANDRLTAGVGFAYTSNLPSASDGNWHCVAVSYDHVARRATVFVDGYTQAIAATTLGPGSQSTLSIGGSSLVVDNMFIFNRALSSPELVDVCSSSSLAPATPGCSSTLAQKMFIKAAVVDANDTFGRTVALDDVGSTLVVGAPREAGSVAGVNGNARDNALAGAGAAYLFAKPNGTGALAQIAYVKASNPGAGDEFGGAVALSGDGSTLAVAAAGEASNANVINGNQLDNSAPRAGAVYIFTQNPPGGAWTQQAYIKASNAGANDQFGLALSLSFDGSTLAVGAPFEDSNGASQADNSLPDSGAVYVFARTMSWSQTAYLKASNVGGGDRFGASVALSGDGLTLAVGAPSEDSNGSSQADNTAPDSGAVYVFTRGGSWSQTAYLKASNVGGGDQFGASVALGIGGGGTLAVGAPFEDSSAGGVNGNQALNDAMDAGAVYVFARNTAGTLVQQAYVKAMVAQPMGQFGWSVSLAQYGNSLLVGAVGDDGNRGGVFPSRSAVLPFSGGVFLYARSGGVLSLQAFIKASNPDANDRFGWAVALGSSSLVVGAWGESAGAGGINSPPLDNSADSSGAAYLFNYEPSCPVPSTIYTYAVEYVKASNPAQDAALGAALALASASDTMVVGAPLESNDAVGVNGNQTAGTTNSSGAAYVFTRSSGPLNQRAYLKASNTGADDRFGAAVAVSGDGLTVAVGAPREASSATTINGNQADNSAPSAGAVYVFIAQGTTYVQQAYLKAANAEAGDGFGDPLVLSGDGNVLAVAARFEDSSGTSAADNSASNSGAVYIFTRTASSWTQSAYIKASNVGAGDRFGSALALTVDGLTLAVGAPLEDSNGLSPSDNSVADSGAAYVFTYSSSTWLQRALLKASNVGAGDEFGTALSLASTDLIAVGAPREDSDVASQFNNNITDSGAVYVFTRTTSWTQTAFIKAGDPGPGDLFGSAVALLISTNDTLLAVGAPAQDSSATGFNGDQRDKNALDSGAVYLLSRAAGWTQVYFIKPLNTEANDQFGTAVAMGNLSMLAVGAPMESSSAAGINGKIDDNSKPKAGAVFVYNFAPPAKQSTLRPITVASTRSLLQRLRTATLDTSSGGFIAGIVLLALSPVVVGALLLVIYAIARRRGAIKAANPSSPSAATLPSSAAIVVLWVLVVLCALAGAGLVGYALYSFVEFEASLANPRTVFDDAKARLNNVSDWASVDCSLSSTLEVDQFGISPCECFVNSTTRLWQCFSRLTLSSSQDCTIDASSWCTCGQTLVNNRAVAWTCAVDAIAGYITPNASTYDLGLRFLPPGMANELGTFPYFRNVPASVGANDTFFMLFAEPVPDISPISGVLVASLCIDLVGMVLLFLSLLYELLVRRGVMAEGLDKVHIGQRSFKVLMLVEMFLLLVGLVLFGVTLVVAFTNPILYRPVAKVQRLETRTAVARLQRDIQGGLPTAAPQRYCKCPIEYESRCTSTSGTLEFGPDTVWNASNAILGCSVLVRGALTITASQVVMGDLRVLGGQLSIQSALLVQGSVQVVGGNVTGNAWNAPDIIAITGDVSIVHGSLLVPSTGAAQLDGVRGRVLIDDGSLDYTGARLVVSVTDVLDARSRLHVRGALQLPRDVGLVVAPSYPLVTWQPTQSVVLATSDTSVSVTPSGPAVATVEWTTVQSYMGSYVCSAMAITTQSSGARLSVSFTQSCSGLPPLYQTAWQASAAQLLFPPVSSSYPLVTPDGLTLRFAFNRSNCGSSLAYRREVDWLETIEQAGLSSTVFTICPRSQIVKDELSSCVHYVCNGTFSLPDRVGQTQQNLIVDNVVQSVVYDAVATALDVAGVVLEHVVLALVVTAALAVAAGAAGAVPMSPNPQFQVDPYKTQ